MPSCRAALKPFAATIGPVAEGIWVFPHFGCFFTNLNLSLAFFDSFQYNTAV